MYISSLLLSSCAVRYKAINPPDLEYTNLTHQNGFDIFVKHDVLRKAWNFKYSRKCERKDIEIIAVKLTNTPDSVLYVDSDLSFW